MLWPPRDQVVRPSMAIPCAASRSSHCGSVSAPTAKAMCSGPCPSCGDRAARHAHRLERRAAVKQQQHALTADIVGAKPRVAGQCSEPQHLLVEARRAVEVIDVETGLD